MLNAWRGGGHGGVIVAPDQLVGVQDRRYPAIADRMGGDPPATGGQRLDPAGEFRRGLEQDAGAAVIGEVPALAARASPARSLAASSPGGPAAAGSSTSIGVVPAPATRRWNAATEEPCHGSGTPAASVSR